MVQMEAASCCPGYFSSEENKEKCSGRVFIITHSQPLFLIIFVGVLLCTQSAEVTLWILGHFPSKGQAGTFLSQVTCAIVPGWSVFIVIKCFA